MISFSAVLSSWPPSTFPLLRVRLHKDQGGWGHTPASNVFCRAEGDMRNFRGHYYNQLYFYCFYLLEFPAVFLSFSLSFSHSLPPCVCMCVCAEAGDGIDSAAWNLFMNTTDIDRSLTKSQRLWKWRSAELKGSEGSAITFIISWEWENKRKRSSGRKVKINQTKWIAKQFGLIKRYMWNSRS